MGPLSPTTNALASPIAVHRNGEKPADLNIRTVVLGNVAFKTWYPSFYPEELVGRELDRLYICQWCFKYSKDVMPYLAHTVSILSSCRHSVTDRTISETVPLQYRSASR